jgi:hypothetical protein
MLTLRRLVQTALTITGIAGRISDSTETSDRNQSSSAIIGRRTAASVTLMMSHWITHCFVAGTLLAGVTWALLTPDPFGLIRQTPIGWLAKLDDLFQHAGAFCLVSLTIFSLCVRLTGSVPASAILIVLGHGITTELLQAFVPGRTSDPTDALANGLGILLGLNLVFAMQAGQRHLLMRRTSEKLNS